MVVDRGDDVSNQPQRIGTIGSVAIMESAPGAPILLSVDAGVSSLTVNWEHTATGGSPITGSNVLRGTTPGGETLLASNVNALTYVDTTPSPGVTYYFKVEDINAIGTSPPSNELSNVLPTVPGAPTLGAPTTGNGSVSFTWTAGSTGGSPLTSQKILRGTSSGAETLLTSVSPHVLNFVDTAATNGTTWFYKVEGVNAVGTSAPSNEISALPGPGTTVPPPVTNLAVVVNGSTAVITWTNNGSTGTNNPTTGDLIYLDNVQVGNPSPAVTTWTFNNLSNGSHTLGVAPFNGAGNGTRTSIPATVVPPPPPSGVAVAQVTTTGGPPGARGQGYGGYDPVSGLIVYFGGNKGPALSDTWALNPATNAWTHITSATAPANVAVCIGHDPISNKLIMFGGDNESTFFNTTYSMDTTISQSSWAWTQLHPSTNPGIRSGASMFNDPITGDLMMCFGNTGTPTYYDDLWRWTGTNWTEVSTALTGTGRTGAFVATMSNGTTVIFGGFANGVLNDTHVWNGTTSVSKSPATVPPARGFGGCAQTNNGFALIYGGANRLSTVNSSDCWLWDGTNWTLQTPTGVNMGGLSSQSMNWHPPTAKIISAFGTAGASANPGTDINTVYAITVGTPTPPPTSSCLLGLYDESNTVSQLVSLASTLGVSAELKVYSFYTDGGTWGSIGSWTVPGTIPSGGTLGLAVDLTPNNTGCSAVPGNSAAQSAFTTLAGHLPNGTIVRLGWEFDIPTGPWGKGANVSPANTPANYVTAFQTVVGWMRAANPTLKFDWCCNTGTSTLAQLQTYYPGDSFVDYIGGDHYANPGTTTVGDFSAFGPVVNLAAQRNKPVSCGEWGLATSQTQDNAVFVNAAVQFFLNPVAAAARYGWPPYTTIYQSYFNALSSIITGFPNAKAAYTAGFG